MSRPHFAENVLLYLHTAHSHRHCPAFERKFHSGSARLHVNAPAFRTFFRIHAACPITPELIGSVMISRISNPVPRKRIEKPGNRDSEIAGLESLSGCPRRSSWHCITCRARIENGWKSQTRLPFEIFDRIEVPAPVIFTTAYDEYELKAFKVNALDYLIKPIDPEEVKTAIKKYSNMTEMACAGTIAGRYPQKLLVSNKDRLVPISTSEVAYIYMSDKNGHICLSDGTRFRNRCSLDEMSKLLRSCLKFFLRKFETGFCAGFRRFLRRIAALFYD